MIPEIEGMTTGPFVPGTDGPVLAEREDSWLDLAEWARAHREFIDALVVRRGGILFRGFGIDGERDFAEVVKALSEPLAYLYRSTPRTDLGGNVYTATEYPAHQHIPLHCENAYQKDWPMRLFFLCERPARRGGETPLADVARVTETLPPDLRERFVRRGIMYVRNYRPGLDLPWQTVFQTTEREEVESYCDANDIDWEWVESDVLRTRQVRGAMVEHPDTGRLLWFNQAHLFHVSSLPPAVRSALADVYAEDELPRNALYGDGSPIDEADLVQIREAFARNAIAAPWRRGDVLVLDNMATAHGRTAFEGDRRVLVAMGDPYSRRPDAHGR
jgi:alpha-ketoglutarate-dependent taurine dioxygenase